LCPPLATVSVTLVSATSAAVAAVFPAPRGDGELLFRDAPSYRLRSGWSPDLFAAVVAAGFGLL